MRVLLCHTYYTQRGGEDCCFEEERDLLRSHGVETAEYVRRNDELLKSNRLSAATKTLWNRQAAREVAAAARRHRADVVHVTNAFPLLSPAVCWAAARSGAAVVQALHNYRWLCAGAYLMRDGQPCNDCVGRRIPWPAVRHACYRNSRAASAVVAGMQLVHRLRDWRHAVDAFFTPSHFARERFVEAGFPADRVHVKYNSVADPGPPTVSRERYVAFIGRLSPEKGVEVLLDAWRRDATLPQLKIAGDGPLASRIQAAADADPRIELLGQLPTEKVQRLLAGATVMVMPSLWYETFGRTIAEAYAAGTPAIVSRLGAMAELVEEGRTGWLFQAGDAAELAACGRRALAMADSDLDSMRTVARAVYERQFKPEQNFQRMIEIYRAAIEHAQLRRRGAAATRTVEPSFSIRPSTVAPTVISHHDERSVSV